MTYDAYDDYDEYEAKELEIRANNRENEGLEPCEPTDEDIMVIRARYAEENITRLGRLLSHNFSLADLLKDE